LLVAAETADSRLLMPAHPTKLIAISKTIKKRVISASFKLAIVIG
jgi:hypothetical protein